VNFFKSFYFWLALFTSLTCNFVLFHWEFNRAYNQSSIYEFFTGPLEFVESKILDLKFKIRKPRIGNPKIVIVAIDEQSLDDLGRWQSWPRQHYAQAIAKLDEYQAKVVGFDIVFDSKDENVGYQYLKNLSENYERSHPQSGNDTFKESLNEAYLFSNTDWALVESVKAFNQNKNRSLVLGYFTERPKEIHKGVQVRKEMPSEFKYILRSSVVPKTAPGFSWPLAINKWVGNKGLNFKELNQAAPHHGYFSMNPDSDGMVRHYDLVRRSYETFFPSLALKMVEQFYQTNALITHDQAGGIYVDLVGTEHHIGLDEFGRVKVNYQGKQNSFITVSLSHLIDDKETIHYDYQESFGAPFEKNKAELFKDAIVLFGATAIGIFDIRNTPVQVNLPGVEIHANIISQFLNKNFLTNDDEVLLISFLGLSTFGIFIFVYVMMKFEIFVGLLSVFGLNSLIFMIDQFYFFEHNQLFRASPLYFSFIFLYITINTYKYFTESREKQKIKGTFSKYVSAEVVTKMIEDPKSIKMGGETKELTVLFSDIADFTSFSEKLTPEELSQLLNTYLSAMTEILFLYKGTLDKYIGDAVMGFWGAPIEVSDHALQGCRAALAMQKKVRELSPRFKNQFGVDLKVRIGINTAAVAVGNMGSETQFAYTCLGDGVNLSSRLEGINKIYGTDIIVGEDTFQQVRDCFQFRLLDQVAVKGKKVGVKIYELLGNKQELLNLNELALQRYSQGLQHYFDGKFNNALKMLNSSDLKDDRASREIIKRCEYLLSTLPATDNEMSWNGVWVMTSK